MNTRVTIRAYDLDLMVDLVRRFHLDVVRTTARVRRDGGYRVDAIVDEAGIAALATVGCDIDVMEDAVAHAATGPAEIDGPATDRPVGRPYFPPVEDESRQHFPPKQTW